MICVNRHEMWAFVRERAQLLLPGSWVFLDLLYIRRNRRLSCRIYYNPPLVLTTNSYYFSQNLLPLYLWISSHILLSQRGFPMLHLSHITTILSRIRYRVPHIDEPIRHNNPSEPSLDLPSEEKESHVGRIIPSSKDAFVQLPSEIILCIADHLEKESRVLLSLTSKHMHAVMSSNMCLNLRDNLEQRKRFLT